MNTIEKQDSLTLGILEAIEKNEGLTQRHLASDLGVALGLANSYLKRCAHKGLIKISQAPANRYLYYLTPKGFTEKGRLTAKFLSSSLDFYRRASNDYYQLILECENSDYKRIVLCGISELAEIASLRLNESKREIIAVYSPWPTTDKFLDKPVYSKIEQIPQSDVLLLTEMNRPVEILEQVKNYYGDYRSLLIPAFLKSIRE